MTSNGSADQVEDDIAEFGTLGVEIAEAMNGATSNGKTTKSSKLKPSKKRPRMDIINVEDINTKSRTEALMNRLLTEHVLKLEDELKFGGKKSKRPRKKIDNPTDKQRRQWAKFSSRVKIAKAIYKDMGESSPENWKAAMQKAYAGGLTSDSPVEQPDAQMGGV